MRITKFGHACVRLETGRPHDRARPRRLHRAGGGRRRHRGADHPRAPRPLLARPPAPYRRSGVHDRAPSPRRSARRRRTSPSGSPWSSPASSSTPAYPTTVVGEKHAVIHPEMPHFDNSGYLLEVEDIRIFHPGDSLTVPERGRRPAAAPGQRSLAEGQRVHRLRPRRRRPALAGDPRQDLQRDRARSIWVRDRVLRHTLHFRGTASRAEPARPRDRTSRLADAACHGSGERDGFPYDGSTGLGVSCLRADRLAVLNEGRRVTAGRCRPRRRSWETTASVGQRVPHRAGTSPAPRQLGLGVGVGDDAAAGEEPHLVGVRSPRSAARCRTRRRRRRPSSRPGPA